MKTPASLLPVAMFLAVCSLSTASAQTLLLGYNFNGTNSTTTTNAGTSAGATLTYHNASNQVVNLYSPSGTGVSGQSGDTALQNTSASGMGTIGNSAAGASTQSKSVDLGTMGSFTIAGWYNAETTPGSSAKLFELNGTSGTITLINESSDRLALNIFGSSSSKNSFSTAGYGATGSWVFFAVTYDGTTSTNNLSFYVGNSSTLSTAGTRSITADSNISLGLTGVGVGNGYYNAGAANRPFDGLMDNVVFYGGAAGTSDGILTLSELDALRVANLSNVPEPTSIVLVLGGTVLGLGTARRPRRSRFSVRLAISASGGRAAKSRQ